MNYKRIYDSIIGRAQNRDKLVGYKEKHHIIPRSLGGSDDKTNMVDLTAREHFVCHYLLTKIFEKETNEWYRMTMAFMCMKSSALRPNRYFNSKLYESLRKDFSNCMSYNQSGEKNSQFGTFWIYNMKLNKSKKVPKKDIDKWLQNGWLKGRKLQFPEKEIKPCKKCNEIKCDRPEVCNKHQMINTLIKVFGFDKATFGSEKFYDEYDRVVKVIHNEYHKNLLSTVEISRKYGISQQRVDSIFKSVGIKHRSYEEGHKNYFKKKSVDLVETV